MFGIRLFFAAALMLIAGPVLAMGSTPRPVTGTAPFPASMVTPLAAANACVRRHYDGLVTVAERERDGRTVDEVTRQTTIASDAQRTNNKPAFDAARAIIVDKLIILAAVGYDCPLGSATPRP